MFLKILLITIVFMALAFAGFAVKMFFKKDGEFKKSCSSVHPKTGERLGCACGGDGDGSCKNIPVFIKTKTPGLDGSCQNKETVDTKIKIQPLQVD